MYFILTTSELLLILILDIRLEVNFMEDISVKFVKTCKDFGVKVTYINKDGIRVRLKISFKKY